MRRALLLLTLWIAGCTGPILVQSSDPAEVTRIAVFFRAEQERFLQTFPEAHRPQEKQICTVLPSLRALEDYGRARDCEIPAWVGGYYSNEHKNVVVVAGASRRTLSHEYAHQLVVLGGLGRPQFWYTEGFATNFEESDKRTYRDRLRGMRAAKELIPLAAFGRMTQPGPEILDSYAEAWGTFQFMLTHHRYELFHNVVDLGVFQTEFERFIDSLPRD
jgi:hypothetical protein